MTKFNKWINISLILVVALLTLINYPFSSNIWISGQDYYIKDNYNSGVITLNKKGLYEQDKTYFREYYQENITNLLHPAIYINGQQRELYRIKPYVFEYQGDDYAFARSATDILLVSQDLEQANSLIEVERNGFFRNNLFDVIMSSLTNSINRTIACPQDNECADYLNNISLRVTKPPLNRRRQHDFLVDTSVDIKTRDYDFGLMSKLTVPPSFQLCNGDTCYDNPRSIDTERQEVTPDTEVIVVSADETTSTTRLGDVPISDYEYNNFTFMPDYLLTMSEEREVVEINLDEPIYFLSETGFRINVELLTKFSDSKAFLEPNNFNLTLINPNCNIDDCKISVGLKVEE